MSASALARLHAERLAARAAPCSGWLARSAARRILDERGG